MNDKVYKSFYLFLLNLGIVSLVLFVLHKLSLLRVDLIFNESWLFAILIFSFTFCIAVKDKLNRSRYLTNRNIETIFEVSPYFFLSILIILAVNQFLKLDFLISRNFHIVVLGIAFGFLAFYRNRDRIENELEDEKNPFKKYFYILFVFLFILWLLRAINILPLIRMSIEEGTYLYTGLLVFKGYVPIADFFNGPGIVWPYVYGLMQFVFGQSLILGRWTSLAFTIGDVILVFLISKKIYGLRVASISVCFLFSLLTLHHQIISNSYSLASFLALLSIYIYLISNSKKSLEMLSVSIMSFSVGVRITMIVALFFLLLVHYLSFRDLRRTLLLIGVSFITGFIIFGIIFLINPKLFIFNVFGRVSVPIDLFLTAYKPQLENSFQIKINAIKDLYTHYPFDFLSLILFSLIIIYKLFFRKWSWFKNVKFSILIYVSIIGIMTISLLPAVTNYLMYVLVAPFGAILNSYFIMKLFSFQKINWRFAIIIFSLSLLIIFLTDSVSKDPYLYKKSPVDEINDVGNYISNHTPEGSKLLTFYTPLNIASKRENYINLNRGYFSYYPFVDFDRANGLKIMSTEELIEIISTKNPSAVALDKLYFYDRMSLDKEQFDLILDKIKENYYLDKEFYVQGIGKIEVYFKKN